MDPSSLRLRATGADGLVYFGLDDDALLVWPFPNNILPIVARGSDDAYALELAQRRYAEDPNNPGALEGLAWAYWSVDNKEEALKLAGRYLNSLGALRRPIDGINYMFVLDAWQRSDEEAMLSRLRPIEASLDLAIESGVDISFLDVVKANFRYMRGETDNAYDYLDKAYSTGLIAPADVARNYDLTGWNELPRFVALRTRHDEYRRDERQKFLAVTCGPDGFTSWQPSSAACAEVESL